MSAKYLPPALCIALFASACAVPIDVQAIKPSTTLLGVTASDLGDSRRAAAIDVIISPADARWIARFEDSNVYLSIHRCDDTGDAYPSFAILGGRMLDVKSLAKASQGKQPVILTFFLPENVARRGAYDCATLEARGMVSPVFFKSLPQRLPNALRFAVPLRPSANGS